MSRTLTDPSAGSTINRILPIYNGGSEEITAPDALLAFNGVPASDYNQLNGVASLNSSGKLPFSILPDSVSSAISIIGPELLYIGSKGIFTITNYDNRINYIVTASAGFISRYEDEIHFTAPATEQTVTITVGDKEFTVDISKAYIDKPSIDTPTDNALVSSSGIMVHSSDINLVGYNPIKSLRFKGINSNIYRPTFTDQVTKWTFSGWYKRTRAVEPTGSEDHDLLFGETNTVGQGFRINIADGGRITVNQQQTGVGLVWGCSTNQLTNLLGSWFHLAIIIDTTLATQTDRIQIYLNGVRQTIGVVYAWPVQNSLIPYLNHVVSQYKRIGAGFNSASTLYYYRGYMAEIQAISGQAVTVDSFGELDPDLGIWVPKAYTGTYGTSGFYLDFKDNYSLSTIGWDKSGQGNDWVCNNISVTAGATNDSMDDSPTNNYATLDALTKGANVVLYDGNLRVGANTAANYGYARSTLEIVKRSYCEMTLTTFPAGSTPFLGIATNNDSPSDGVVNAECIYYSFNGNIYKGTTVIGTAPTIAVNDIIGVAYDKLLDILTYYKNGTLVWSGNTGLSANTIYFVAGDRSSNAIEITVNFGQRAFTYTPPNGYTGLYTPEKHTSTDWQLATEPSFATPLLESLADTTNLTSWPASGMALDSDYYIRCRYHGYYGTSEWSDVKHIKTRESYLPTQEMGILTASDKAVNDWYGFSVALSSDGSRLAVGAYQKTVSGVSSCGKVYIYARSGSTWTLEAEISASDKAASDGFGSSVSFDSAGSRLAVGAQLKDPSAVTNAGKVYTYVRSGVTWSAETTITAPSLYSNGYFGSSVSFDSEANRLAIGEYGKNAGGASFSGQAYVYTRSGSIYTLESQISASDFAANDSFGVSVALDGDGSRLAVGAYGKDDTFTDTGKVYIYTRTTSTWTQETTITASDKAAGDQFGTSVSLSGDSSKLAIGAFSKDLSGVSDAGQVYLYTRSGNIWTLEATIAASDKAVTNWFGYGVSLSADASMLAIGSPSRVSEGVNDAGSVYIFQ